MLRSSEDLKKILNEDLHDIFFRNLSEISWRYYMKILRISSVHLKKYDDIFLKLKIKKKSGRFLLKIFQRSQQYFYWRSFADLKKILVEDLRKIPIRLKLKIFERSQKDFPKKFYEDLLKKLYVNLLNIFRRFLEEKILIKNLHQILSS